MSLNSRDYNFGFQKVDKKNILSIIDPKEINYTESTAET